MAKTQGVKKIDKVKRKSSPQVKEKSTVKDNPVEKEVKSRRKCPSRSRKSKEFWKRTRNSHRVTKKKPRGVVYLSHIPHGFYEKQIEGYFQQFGQVTAVSVPKSKSGNAKGFAFVEFLHPEVAEIAAETMNNYLMFNRVIKAKYLPPAEQKPHLLRLAVKAKKQHTTLPEKYELAVKHNRKVKNRKLKVSLEAKLTAKLLRKSKILNSKLKSVGLNYKVQVQKGDIDAIFERNKELKLKRKEKRESQEPTSEDESEGSEDEEELSEDEVELSSPEDDDVSSIEDLRSMSKANKKRSTKNVHK